MRNRWLQKIFLLTAILAPPALPAPATATNVDTIDQLVALTDDSGCVECHEEIYRQWQQSWHARAVVASLDGIGNFISIGLAREWNKPLDKAQLLKCLDCHAPVVNLASEKLAREIGDLIVTAADGKDEKAGAAARAQLSRLNVGCLSCHNLKATAVSLSLLGEPVKGKVYGPKGHDSAGHDTVASVELTRSVFCMQCHGKYYAPDGETIQCNTLSGSYQNTYYNLGGTETCQDCHMKKGHLFPGGHDLDTVKEGLGLEVQLTKYRHLPGQVKGVKDAKAWIPSAVANVFITNNAGHRIPDG
jgi:hypothetical protein